MDDGFNRLSVTHHKRADPLGRADLVAGNGEECALEVGEGDRLLAEGLDRVGMERGCDGTTAVRDFLDRLHHTHLVVDPHHRDHRGLPLQRAIQRLEVKHSVGANRQDHLGAAQMNDVVRRSQDRLVLDGRDARHHGLAAISCCQSRAHYSKVVGLGSARCEDHLVGLGAERGGHLAAGLLEPRTRGPAEAVGTGRVAEALAAQVWQHRLEHFRPHRGGGSMIEVDVDVRHGPEI